MKRILLSLFALLAFTFSASADVEPTYTAKGTVAPVDDEDWASSTDDFPVVNDVTVEVYGTDSIIVRGWAGVEGYDLVVVLKDGNMTELHTLINGSPYTYQYGSYWYVDAGNTTEPYPFYAYFLSDSQYSSFESDPETKSGYLNLWGYSYYNAEGTSSTWSYYNIDWSTDDDASGISSPVVAAKRLNAATYNLAGQRVGADYKGIVLQNGQKFIRK